MKKSLVSLSLYLVVLAVLAGFACADTQSLFGTTGLLLTPTAEIPGPMQLSGSAYFVSDRDFNSYSATGGFLNYEVSVARLDYTGSTTPSKGGNWVKDDETIYDLKMKYAPMTGVGTRALPFDLGIGIIDASDEIDRSWYVTATMPVSLGASWDERIPHFKVNVGIGGGMYDGLFWVYRPPGARVSEPLPNTTAMTGTTGCNTGPGRGGASS